MDPALLELLARRNPRLAELAAAMRPEATAPTAADQEPPAEARLRSRLVAARRRVRELERHNAHLASACGACSCWGDDPDCDECEGDGTPGNWDLDETAFMTFIFPLLEALELVRPDASDVGLDAALAAPNPRSDR